MSRVPGGGDPLQPQYWFIMSMSLLAGFIAACPINWWMVANHMKHGMITVLDTGRHKRESAVAAAGPPSVMAGMADTPGGMEMPDGHPGSDGDMAGMAPGSDPSSSSGEMAEVSAGTALEVRMLTLSVGTLLVTLWIVTTHAPGA
jgi:Domain of unknown function (DUF4396)